MKQNTVIMAMYDLNKHLSKKTKQYRRFYGLAIICGSLFFIIFVGIPLFTNIADFVSINEELTFYNAMIYFLVCGDIFMFCL